jgi:hypothetical protein
MGLSYGRIGEILPDTVRCLEIIDPSGTPARMRPARRRGRPAGYLDFLRAINDPAHEEVSGNHLVTAGLREILSYFLSR